MDWFATLAHAVFVLVGGILVFGFAWALFPAVESQNGAACRPLSPETRDMEAPGFTVQDLQGNTVSLEEFAGKFVILNFWATWCEPCVQEWPELDQLAQRLGDRDDVVILAVSVDENREDVGTFLERLQLQDTSVRVLWDPEHKLNDTYGSPKLPDTHFIGRDGRVEQVFVNVRDWGNPTAFNCVQTAAGR